MEMYTWMCKIKQIDIHVSMTHIHTYVCTHKTNKYEFPVPCTSLRLNFFIHEECDIYTCSVLQCVAVCCSVLQCVAVCNTIQLESHDEFVSAQRSSRHEECDIYIYIFKYIYMYI